MISQNRTRYCEHPDTEGEIILFMDMELKRFPAKRPLHHTWNVPIIKELTAKSLREQDLLSVEELQIEVDRYELFRKSTCPWCHDYTIGYYFKKEDKVKPKNELEEIREIVEKAQHPKLTNGQLRSLVVKLAQLVQNHLYENSTCDHRDSATLKNGVLTCDRCHKEIEFE